MEKLRQRRLYNVFGMEGCRRVEVTWAGAFSWLQPMCSTS